MDNLNSLEYLQKTAKKVVFNADSLDEVESLRVSYLGKNGKITKQLKQIGSLSHEQRRFFGQQVHTIKLKIQEWLETRRSELARIAVLQKIENESIDVTQHGRRSHQGFIHPISRTLQRIQAIFDRLGFDVATGPEIEDEYHNFEALNISAGHPSRALHDTFYLDEHTVLRTHTSPVQIRYMHQNQPPMRVIAPGRVYRCDSDATHTPMFHQLEGLAVDSEVNFADLKGVLIHFFQEFFEKDLDIRFRPSYFPFTEPSAEVDIACIFCKGAGCRICKQNGWLEVLGCGMVHPEVFKHNGVDTRKYNGYAFGLGIERLTMLRYGVNDSRLFFNNALSFLRQF